MAKTRFPVTPAIRMLREHGASWQDYLYPYEAHGGAEQSAHALGIDLHQTVKTLIMENERHVPMIVLMHGDYEVSTQQLARTLGDKHIQPCDPVVAQKHSGYQVGGTSPFGTRTVMPVYLEASIASLDKLYINGGKRGYVLAMSPETLIQILHPVLVNVGIPNKR